MDDKIKWNFPEYIEFEDVSDLMKKFDAGKNYSKVIFDLSKTTRLHSSFIGFLIHAKATIEKNDGVIKLIISSSVQKLFIMLQVYNHFLPILLAPPKRKSA